MKGKREMMPVILLWAAFRIAVRCVRTVNGFQSKEFFAAEGHQREDVKMTF